jgi:hypothetical protein
MYQQQMDNNMPMNMPTGGMMFPPQFPYRRNKSSSGIMIIVVVIVILLLIGGGISFYFMSQSTTQMPTTKSSSSGSLSGTGNVPPAAPPAAPPAPPVNCQASWQDGSCAPGKDGKRKQTYKIEKDGANGGQACEASNGATKERDDSTCSIPKIDCQGRWATETGVCVAGKNYKKRVTYNVTRQAVNGGQACEATNGQTKEIDDLSCKPSAPPGYTTVKNDAYCRRKLNPEPVNYSKFLGNFDSVAKCAEACNNTTDCYAVDVQKSGDCVSFKLGNNEITAIDNPSGNIGCYSKDNAPDTFSGITQSFVTPDNLFTRFKW